MPKREETWRERGGWGGGTMRQQGRENDWEMMWEGMRFRGEARGKQNKTGTGNEGKRKGRTLSTD